jgi:hypothetical protein
MTSSVEQTESNPSGEGEVSARGESTSEREESERQNESRSSNDEIISDDSSSDEEDVEARMNRLRVESALREADKHLDGTRAELESAKIDESAYFYEKGHGDEEKGRQTEVEQTSIFWTGSDWTEKEKEDLEDAKWMLTIGLSGGLATLVISSVNVMGAQENVTTAQDRIHAANSTSTDLVDQDTLNNAQTGANGAIIVTAGAAVTFVGLVILGLRRYYRVYTEHSRNVKAMNNPEVVVQRKKLENKIECLEKKKADLESERAKL